MINFIGLGAQKSGTSWVYSCLYEHPEICAPIKELHYFSRDRFSKGQDWYESHFSACKPGLLTGEFSTSYLASVDAPARIAESNPDAKLIAILRNPIDRAYSQFRNAIKAGEIKRSTTFDSYLRDHPEALTQGLYAKQLYRYYEYFSRVQLHVAIYEDSKKDPLAFIAAIYEFLEIRADFVPKMLKQYVNTARSPRLVWIDRLMHKVAELLRRTGLHRLVWWVKRSGMTDAVRAVNKAKDPDPMPEHTRARLQEYFKKDVQHLSQMLHRDLHTEWNI